MEASDEPRCECVASHMALVRRGHQKAGARRRTIASDVSTSSNVVSTIWGLGCAGHGAVSLAAAEVLPGRDERLYLRGRAGHARVFRGEMNACTALSSFASQVTKP
jgi:hypothetical protein